MSARLTPFLFEEEHLVRSVTDAGDPWFVIADVCRVLGISNHRDAASRLDDDEKGVGVFETAGGPQEMVIINEIGLYTLILRSHGAITPGTFAHRFRKWVAGEVLPSIRKTGAYAQSPTLPPLDLEARREVQRLSRDIQRETNPAVRRMLYELLVQTTGRLGIATPKLDELGKDANLPVQQVTQLLTDILSIHRKGPPLNHSRTPGILAVNLSELNRHAGTGLPCLRVDILLRRALQSDPRFRGSKTIRSAIDPRRTLKCWLFAHDE